MEPPEGVSRFASAVRTYNPRRKAKFPRKARTITSAPLNTSRKDLSPSGHLHSEVFADKPDPRVIGAETVSRWERQGGWNTRHHITPSKGNSQIHTNYKSFFDRPTEWGHGCALSPEKSQMSRAVKNPWALPKVLPFEQSYDSKVNIVTGHKLQQGLKTAGSAWGCYRACNLLE